MNVSVVISTRNRAGRLDACLTSFAKLETAIAWELIVVDNGSTDDTIGVLTRHQSGALPNLTVVTEPRKGLSRARNTGWRTAAAPIVAFTDDDCYPSPDWIDNLTQAFAADPRVGFVGGRVRLHDSDDYPITVQERTTPCRVAPGDFVPAGLIHGANFAFRREVLVALDGFAESLGAGTRFPSEDVDAQARATALDWQGLYDPRLVVRHHHGRKASDVRRLQHAYTRGRGAYYFRSLGHRGLRKTYLRNWLWLMRTNPIDTSAREVLAAVEYLARQLV